MQRRDRRAARHDFGPRSRSITAPSLATQSRPLQERRPASSSADGLSSCRGKAKGRSAPSKHAPARCHRPCMWADRLGTSSNNMAGSFSRMRIACWICLCPGFSGVINSEMQERPLRPQDRSKAFIFPRRQLQKASRRLSGRRGLSGCRRTAPRSCPGRFGNLGRWRTQSGCRRGAGPGAGRS